MISHGRVAKLPWQFDFDSRDGVWRGRIEEEVEVKKVIDVCKSLLVTFRGELDISDGGYLMLGNCDGLCGFSCEETIVVILLGV